MNGFSPQQQFPAENSEETPKIRKRKLENDENEEPESKLPANIISSLASMVDQAGSSSMGNYSMYPAYNGSFNMNFGGMDPQQLLQPYNGEGSCGQAYAQSTPNPATFVSQQAQFQQNYNMFHNYNPNLFNSPLTDNTYSSNQSQPYLNSTDSGLGTSGSMGGSLHSTANSELQDFLQGAEGEATETVGIEVHPDDVKTKYDEVPGRLALLNANVKHTVTLAEVKRRLGHPEGLNMSLIGGYLRKAKNKNGGQKIKEQLSQAGISIPSGKRRQTDPTAFTALTESETNTLVEDFDALNRKFFPQEAFIQEVQAEFMKPEVYNAYIQIQQGYLNPQRAVETVKFVLRICRNIMQRDQSIYEHRGFTSPYGKLSPRLQHDLETFNLVTHDFAVRAFTSMLSALIGETEPEGSFDIPMSLQ
ncbi:unnamed protein product [Bursaphelenchus xylophilus]|uniref:(pine wood nematode) hypothetical protein n=1 Tax=Bursaphelenchus xylophilus TaxID=6326 RepID=A0A1I7SPY1_BURXY|nr:unnamed protein product [Bursaphelenchus xylophilus]CAG9109350.1 unnamed protein product [Bursaphelenchus xylophilus]